jgi:hypothetical protein
MTSLTCEAVSMMYWYSTVEQTPNVGTKATLGGIYELGCRGGEVLALVTD